MKALAQPIWAGFGVFMALFMLSPLFLVVLFSFGENDLASFPMEGVTLRWYETLFANDDFWEALANSAILSSSVGVASIVVGTLAALMLARERERTATPSLGLITLPLMLPPRGYIGPIGWLAGTTIPSGVVGEAGS